MFHKQFHRIEDFWEDESFVSWVLGNDPLANNQWDNWVPRNEEEAALMLEARSLLEAVQVKQHPVSADHMQNKVAAIIAALPDRTVPLKKQTFSWRAAAVLIGVTALGALGWFIWNTSGTLRQELVVKQDMGMEEVTNNSSNTLSIWLKDSSLMMLTPGSRARYNIKFGLADRDVFLEGKAIFTVRKDASKPFRVNTDDIVTQVLGTTFTVDAEKDNDAVFVVVQHGKVSVARIRDLEGEATASPVILSPNQEARYGKTSRILLKTLVQQPLAQVEVQHTADFVFTDTPLPEVFEKLEKIYAIRVVYDNPELSQCSLTANLNKEGFYDKLDLICKALRLNYRQTDGQIIISGEGCLKN